MIKSKFILAASIASFAVAFAAPSFADAPDPFNKAERQAALVTEPVKPAAQTAAAPLPVSNAYVKPNKK
ncbi:MAG: hypothetical protein AB7G15_01665 [Alphaproteobacteria bacterium]